MPEDISHKLVIAISSRALFNLEESDHVFQTQGIEEYARYQRAHENDVLAPGIAFSLVQKFLNINQHGDFIEVILLSRNSSDTGLRIFNSIDHYQLNITRAAFTDGQPPHRYARAFGASLFLSANSQDVSTALRKGIAAATVLGTNGEKLDNKKNQLRIAFDGDAVLFSDEAEKIYQAAGIKAFTTHEKNAAKKPLAGGPFHHFLAGLHKIQQFFDRDECPIRTALVTARQAPAHERVIRTLREWQIRIDEALFLGGLEKTQFLKEFGADIFFDDHPVHCESAKTFVATGHVPAGINNINDE